MNAGITPAAGADVAAMVGLASVRREQYAWYQAAFWRRAADAEHAGSH
jgi:hypothetical protein